MSILILAILCSFGIILSFKIFKKFEIDLVQAISINYFVASLLGFLLVDGSWSVETVFSASWLKLSIFTGIVFIAGFYLYARSIHKAGIAITSVAGKMSVIIPVAFGVFVFNEPLGALRILGIALTIIAFYLILKKDKWEKIQWAVIIFPLALFLANGANDTLLKFAETLYIKDNDGYILFIATVFFISMIIGFVVALISILNGKAKLHWKNFLAGIILGVLNWYSTYFFLKTLTFLDISVLVPVFNVSLVSLAALFGFLVFKEKLKPINWIGVFIAILAILSIALAK